MTTMDCAVTSLDCVVIMSRKQLSDDDAVVVFRRHCFKTQYLQDTAARHQIFKTPRLQTLDSRHNINKIPLQYTVSRYHEPVLLCLAVKVRQ